jgi:hypothetical protein
VRVVTRANEYLDSLQGAIVEWGLEIDETIIRILSHFIEFILTVHVLSCIWYLVGTAEGSPDNWVNTNEDSPLSLTYSDATMSRYLQAFYYVIITMVTPL